MAISEIKDSGIEWIGQIPKSWRTTILKKCIYELNDSNNPIKTNEVLSLTNKLGVVPYEKKGDQGNKAKEDYTGYKLAYENTLVVNSMNVLIGSVGISHYYGCVSPVYYVFKNTVDADLDFINYIFQNVGFQKELRKYANGIMEIRLRVSAHDILRRIIPFPSLNIQKIISDFLNKECSHINQIVEKIIKSISLLEDLKQSIITEAVTKGVRNTNREMRDSGIEWIGQIPEQWSLLRTKNIFSTHKKIVGSDSHKFQRLALTMRGVIERSKEDNKGLQPEEFSGYQIVNPGELIFKLIDLENTKTSRVGLSHNQGIVSPAYIILEPKSTINTKYAEFYFLSLWYRNIFNYMGGDGVRSSLSAKDLLNVPIPLPSQEEQEKISSYLEDKCKVIDDIITKKCTLLSELENYKKSLIYEYVTGKKEVPSYEY